MNGKVTVDQLAQVIRTVDGGHSLGAAALAEAILEALPHLQPAKPEAVRLRDELRERSEFEAWAQRNGIYAFNVGSIGYIPDIPAIAWLVWQAAIGGARSPEVDESDQICQEADGCPTERAVLQRFWRLHSSQAPLAATGKQQVGEVSDRYHPAQRQADIEGRIEPSARELEGLHDEQVGEVLTYTYVQTVPDKCDRIVWRGHYYNLPIKQAGEARGDGFLSRARDALTRNTTANKDDVAEAARYIDAAVSARKPVGQEPIGYRWRHSANEKWQYSDIPCGWEYEPLYAIPPAQAVDLGHTRVIGMLLNMAEAAYNLADNANDMEDCGNIDYADFIALSDALDALDGLPDDQPGYTMTEPAKARWALRGLLDVGQAVQS